MKSIIEDIFELRKEKLVRILKNVDPKNPVKFLSNAGAVELNSVRPAFQAAHNVAGQMQNILENCQKSIEANAAAANNSGAFGLWI